VEFDTLKLKLLGETATINGLQGENWLASSSLYCLFQVGKIYPAPSEAIGSCIEKLWDKAAKYVCLK